MPCDTGGGRRAAGGREEGRLTVRRWLTHAAARLFLKATPRSVESQSASLWPLVLRLGMQLLVSSCRISGPFVMTRAVTLELRWNAVWLWPLILYVSPWPFILYFSWSYIFNLGATTGVILQWTGTLYFSAKSLSVGFLCFIYICWQDDTRIQICDWLR